MGERERERLNKRTTREKECSNKFLRLPERELTENKEKDSPKEEHQEVLSGKRLREGRKEESLRKSIWRERERESMRACVDRIILIIRTMNLTLGIERGLVPSVNALTTAADRGEGEVAIYLYEWEGHANPTIFF